MQLKSDYGRLNAMHSKKMRGVSLIEVLVSIVIASIALLALAGVNAASVRYTKMSQYRATAALLANDIGERMRVNKGVAAKAAVPAVPPAAAVAAVAATGFFAGNYDYTVSFNSQATDSIFVDSCNLKTSTCDEAAIAARDLLQWRTMVRKQLPRGSVFILRQSAQVAADVWVAWQDPSATGDDSPTVVNECPNQMSVGADSGVRCSYFRINL